MTANTVPVCIWGLMELARDPILRREIRDEVEAASTGRHFDVQKLVTLPLLQSFYTEVMRLHVSVLVIREALRPFGMEGYTLPARSILQAPSEISHYSESIWGVEGHPASEFWARRHISYDSKGKARFEMMGRPADFFPFGMSFHDKSLHCCSGTSLRATSVGTAGGCLCSFGLHILWSLH
jgi:cytochrome P450